MKYLLQPPVVAALYLRVYLLDHSLQSRAEEREPMPHRDSVPICHSVTYRIYAHIHTNTECPMNPIP